MKYRVAALILGLSLSVQLPARWPAQAFPDWSAVEIGNAARDHDVVENSGQLPLEAQMLEKLIPAAQAAALPPVTHWLSLALIQAKMGQFDAARSSLAQASQVEGGHFDQGDQALQHLVQAQIAYFQADFATARSELGKALSKVNDHAEAKALLRKTEAALANPKAARPCDKPYEALMALPDAQVYDCVKTAQPGDPMLNSLLYRLGETQSSVYVSTLAAFLATPHRTAAVGAMGRTMSVAQLPLLQPYLHEASSLRTLIEVVNKHPTEPPSAALQARLGLPLLKEMQQPDIKADRLLQLVEAVGVLRLRQALPALQQHLREAEAAIEDGYPMDYADAGSALKEQVMKALAEYEKTPLMLALQAGDLDRARHLLASGADFRARTRIGESALSLAVSAGHKDIVAALLAKGLSPDVPGLDEMPLLITAAQAGRQDLVRLLVDHGARGDVKDTHDGKTAMTIAIGQNDDGMVEILARAKGSLTVKDLYDMTALMAAVETGRTGLVERLLELGAKPAQDNSLTVAIEHKNLPLAELLLAHGANPDGNVEDQQFPLLKALAADQDPAFARLLLAHDADVEVRSQWNETSLMLAAGHPDPELFRLMLARRPDVNVATTNGLTALKFALFVDEPESFARIDLLLEQGADINAADAEGETALLTAAHSSLTGVVQYLLAKGADPKATTTSGENALHLAANKCKNEEIVAILVAGGVDVNQGDDWGRTPLFKTEWCKPALFAKALLEHGANPKARNQSGQTVQDVARQNGNKDLLELFEP